MAKTPKYVEKLGEDVEICNQCQGQGWIPSYRTYEQICPKCEGSGIVDWVTNIMGVPNIPIKNQSK